MNYGNELVEAALMLGARIGRADAFLDLRTGDSVIACSVKCLGFDDEKLYSKVSVPKRWASCSGCGDEIT